MMTEDDRVPVMILTFFMDTTRLKEGCMNINITIDKRTLQLVAGYLDQVVSILYNIVTKSFLAKRPQSGIPFYNFTLSLLSFYTI